MRLYRALLHLYPAAYRLEYGGEMERTYARRRATAGGAAGRAALWLREAADVAGSAALVQADVLRQDLRWAFRSLRRSPGFTATAVLVTALGVGANTAVFSVADRVLLRPLPYADADRLVKLWESEGESWRNEVSPPNYRDWKEASSAFAAMVAYHRRSMNLVGRAEPLRITGIATGSDLFPMLGVAPLLGRTLGPGDDAPGAPGALVLSHRAWRELFAAEPGALGAPVRLDDEAFTVVGVMPPGFDFPSREVQAWVPMRVGEEDLADRDNNFFYVLAKLRPGVSLEQAQAQMDQVAARLERAYPAENENTGVAVSRLRDEVPRQTRLLLVALAGAAACVLLIACTNLASLLLARALARRREMALRTALGGGRERLARQLLTEALVLSALGGALGALIATAALPALAALVPATLPLGEIGGPDARVFVTAAVLAVFTGLAFGVVPALRLGRGGDPAALREGGRGGLGSGRDRLRAFLVTAEVAACLLLLVVSGLLLRALQRVSDTDPGFRPAGVLAVNTPVIPARHGETAARVALYRRILDEVEALPGVQRAGYISHLPMAMGGGIWPVLEAEGAAAQPPGERPMASLRFVSPGFFATMDIPLREGRGTAESDTADAPWVAVVSESFVRRHWPGGDALGRRFTFGLAERTVVGVVGDVRVRGLERESEPQVYLPYGQVEDDSLVGYLPQELVVRVAEGIDPPTLAAGIRAVVRRADPELPVAAVRPLADVVGDQTAPRRAQLAVLAAFAGLSLLLAGVGIHGLLALAVSQRAAELSLRRAVGASTGQVVSIVLRQAIAPAARGAVLGVVLAYAAGRLMQALLAGVAPGDGVTFLAATAVAVAMAVTGAALPVIRALRLEPARVLLAAG